MRIERKPIQVIQCSESPFVISFVPSGRPMHWVRVEERPEDGVETKMVTDEERNRELNAAREAIEAEDAEA